MNTVLFDLDGTLLPMVQEEFIKAYLKQLCIRFSPQGYDAKQLSDAVWAGTAAMYGNDGTVTNYERFWECFSKILDSQIRERESEFVDFYRVEFQSVKNSTHPTPLACQVIDCLKQKGYHIVLATNPLFPQIATYSRIRWAGLSPSDFELITTYENSSYCKPNLRYFEEILRTIRKTPQECLMVGNDVGEDMVAANLGLDTYLLTDCIINQDKKDISSYQKGAFSDFAEFVNRLPVNLMNKN